MKLLHLLILISSSIDSSLVVLLFLLLIHIFKYLKNIVIQVLLFFILFLLDVLWFAIQVFLKDDCNISLPIQSLQPYSFKAYLYSQNYTRLVSSTYEFYQNTHDIVNVYFPIDFVDLYMMMLMNRLVIIRLL